LEHEGRITVKKLLIVCIFAIFVFAACGEASEELTTEPQILALGEVGVINDWEVLVESFEFKDQVHSPGFGFYAPPPYAHLFTLLSL